jgi:hypothetical protein
MTGVSGERRLRPFPALDPEPPRRFTWRSMRWPVLGSVTVGVVLAVVLLTWPSSSSSAPSAQARFADGDGVVVFEQQPSGLLGTAVPDGSHQVMLTKVGPLQGNDLPVASSDGRYLVNAEGQLVTMGPAGPVSITNLTQPAGVQTSGYPWLDASFADGSKYVEATECYASDSGLAQSYIADLMPTAGGPDHMLGTVTDSAGDPVSAGSLEAVPASLAAASSPSECDSQGAVPDKALELLQPGQAPRVIVTAAELSHALGLAPGTPLEMSATPDPGGNWLALDITVGAPQTAAAYRSAPHVAVVITRAGKIVAHMPFRGGSWSPDGRQIASCEPFQRVASSARVTIWTVGGTSRTIVLPGRHDLGCDQLLWSPDGNQLMYSAYVSFKGLTRADDLQHGWTVIDLRSGQAHDVTAPGQPAAWLPVRTGRTR